MSKCAFKMSLLWFHVEIDMQIKKIHMKMSHSQLRSMGAGVGK